MNKGDTAPNFCLQAHDGTFISLDSLSSIVVLCFYPKNRIFGCPSKKATKIARSISKVYQDITDAGAVLFAISVDSVESQSRIVKENNIPYMHLSDTKKDTCKKYTGLNIIGLAKRATFVIDRQGTIIDVLRSIDSETHGNDILESVRSCAAQI